MTTDKQPYQVIRPPADVRDHVRSLTEWCEETCEMVSTSCHRSCETCTTVCPGPHWPAAVILDPTPHNDENEASAS